MDNDLNNSFDNENTGNEQQNQNVFESEQENTLVDETIMVANSTIVPETIQVVGVRMAN